MFKELRSSISLFVLLFALTGFGYPLLMLFVGQKIFPQQANGSLIMDDGKIIGSTLIGQNFTSDGYFHGRPSAAGSGYDAANSSGSNLAPTSTDLLKAVTDRVADLKKTNAASIPVDLVTTSGSGLDPDISPDAARFQVARVALARQISPMKIEDLVSQSILSRSFGILGDNRVNVLDLNMRLDKMAGTILPVVQPPQ